METTQILPLKDSFQESISLPGSKSLTNRVLLLAGVSQGSSEIRHLLDCSDSYWCQKSLKQLGIEIDEESNKVTVHGNGGQWNFNAPGQIDVGSAGTTGRFLTALLAASCPKEVLINSSEQLAKRPIKQMLDLLREIGCTIDGNSFPVKTGGLKKVLKNHVITHGTTSSQFISALMLSGPLLKGGLKIELSTSIVQAGYTDITVDVMKSFGIEVEVVSDSEGRRTFTVPEGIYQACDIDIEVDFSTASYFLALAAATKSTITLPRMNPDSHQPDKEFANILRNMGCQVDYHGTELTLTGPDKALKGNFTIDMYACADTSLTLACLAPLADGPIEIRNIAHIRKHESDRIGRMAENLRLLNIKVDEFDDGLKVYPGKVGAGEVEGFDDHRIAMSLAVLGAASAGVTIRGSECVAKTCPNFYELIASLGVGVSKQ